MASGIGAKQEEEYCTPGLVWRPGTRREPHFHEMIEEIETALGQRFHPVSFSSKTREDGIYFIAGFSYRGMRKHFLRRCRKILGYWDMGLSTLDE